MNETDPLNNEPNPTYRVELANKIRNGEAVGNVYLVVRIDRNGRRKNIVAQFNDDADAREEAQRLAAAAVAEGYHR